MNITHTNLVNNPQKPPRKAILKSIRSKVVFGTPGNGCQGVGICRMMSNNVKENGNCPVVSALISVSTEGRLRMKFSKVSMERPFMKRHFGWRLFQVLEAYELPEVLRLKLGFPGGQRWIEAGIYPVWETRDWLIVDF